MKVDKEMGRIGLSIKEADKNFSMQNNESIKPKIVETYAEDMAKVIEDDRGGLIKKIIHSEEEHE